jgi:hypothetical protein
MNFADGVTAKPGAAGSNKKSDQQLHTILENLGRVAHQDDLHSGFTPRLDLEALERKAIYDRLGAIESPNRRIFTTSWCCNHLGLAILDETPGRSREHCCSAVRVGDAASRDDCSDCSRDSPRRPLPRPGANAAANAQSNHPAANRRPNRRRSRRDETCDRQAGVRRRGGTCEAASTAAAAAPRSPGAQADNRAVVLASSNITAPSTSPINSARVSISRMSRGEDRRQSCSRKTRREGSRSISPSCQN